MSDIRYWSTAAASNNSPSPNGFPEAMAPSGVNDAAREVMGAVRRWYEDPVWTNLNHTPTYVSASVLTLVGDKSSVYTQGRRLRLYGSGAMGTLYGSVVSATYGAPNLTLTIITDSGTMDSSLSTVEVSTVSDDDEAFPASIDLGNFAPSTGSATNSFSAVMNNAPGYYPDGLKVRFRATLSSISGTATLNLGNGAPSKQLKKQTGSILADSTLVAGRIYEATFNSACDCFNLVSDPLFKPFQLAHGAQSTSVYTLDIGLAEIHSIEFSATSVLNITSTLTLDRALLIIKNNNFPITITGINNDSPTLTQSAGTQDYVAVVKSFGVIGAVSFVLNKATS